MLDAGVPFQANSRPHHEEMASSLERSLRLMDVLAQCIDQYCLGFAVP